MKKIVAMLLAVITVIALCGCGASSTSAQVDENTEDEIVEVEEIPEFTLRNDIKFGDSIDTVMAKEKELEVKEKSNKIYHFYGKIAGYDNVHCPMFFDENGGLYELYYDFDKDCGIKSQDSADIAYEKLRDSLIRQYGEPLGNEGGDVYLITGKAFNAMALTTAISKGATGKGGLIDYEEWVVDTTDGYVKIDLVYYYTVDKNNKSSFSVNVDYLHFTDDDIMSEVMDKIEENEKIDNDL